MMSFYWKSNLKYKNATWDFFYQPPTLQKSLKTRMSTNKSNAQHLIDFFLIHIRVFWAHLCKLNRGLLCVTKNPWYGSEKIYTSISVLDPLKSVKITAEQGPVKLIQEVFVADFVKSFGEVHCRGMSKRAGGGDIATITRGPCRRLLVGNDRGKQKQPVRS